MCSINASFMLVWYNYITFYNYHLIFVIKKDVQNMSNQNILMENVSLVQTGTGSCRSSRHPSQDQRTIMLMAERRRRSFLRSSMRMTMIIGFHVIIDSMMFGSVLSILRNGILDTKSILAFMVAQNMAFLKCSFNLFFYAYDRQAIRCLFRSELTAR